MTERVGKLRKEADAEAKAHDKALAQQVRLPGLFLSTGP
jgi:hypothetical protein